MPRAVRTVSPLAPARAAGPGGAFYTLYAIWIMVFSVCVLTTDTQRRLHNLKDTRLTRARRLEIWVHLMVTMVAEI